MRPASFNKHNKVSARGLKVLGRLPNNTDLDTNPRGVKFSPKGVKKQRRGVKQTSEGVKIRPRGGEANQQGVKHPGHARPIKRQGSSLASTMPNSIKMFSGAFGGETTPIII